MDAFKAVEIERMRLGGNAAWRTFFEEHPDTKMRGLGWEDATIAERYSGEAGEEWKERLSAKVEGREYIPAERKAAAAPKPRVETPLSGSRTASPTLGGGGVASSAGAGSGGKVKVDDKYFARLGQDNATRSADLPPSQGGKYAGFGNMPAPAQKQEAALPAFEDLQKDPVAALTKGFGWFASTVTKTAKTVNDDFIQPTLSKYVYTRTCDVSFEAVANIAPLDRRVRPCSPSKSGSGHCRQVSTGRSKDGAAGHHTVCRGAYGRRVQRSAH